MAEVRGDLTTRVLFENSRLAVYLHEEQSANGAFEPLTLQVCLRDGLERSFSAGAVDFKEVLNDEELAYIIRRNHSDLLIEFKSWKPPAAYAQPIESQESRAGCWYGCMETEGEEEVQCFLSSLPAKQIELAPQEAAASEPPAESSIAADKLPLTAPAQPSTACWYGCEEEDEAVSRQAEPSGEAEGDGAEGDDVPEEESAGLPSAPSRSSLPRILGAKAKKVPAPARGADEAAQAADGGADSALSNKEACGAPDPIPLSSSEGTVPLPPPPPPAPDEGGEDPWAEGCWYLTGAQDSWPRPPPESQAGEDGELLHLSTSKVEWRIRSVSALLKQHAKGSRVFSPEFNAFGVEGLGLVFYPNGNPNAKQGFCSLGLKAPHGTHLRYKLYIGGTERFTDLRHNVTESWGFVDMCKVEDEVQEDVLSLGVEVIDDIDTHETLKSVSASKVEWAIGNMLNKLEHYKKDIALYSDEFSAGGVDKLRLKFYPSGKKEADLGWCSLYLEAPKGSELRCRLSVGKKSMSFDRLEKFGEDSIWGFLTLCKLQDELESDKQSVRIGLEVLETKRLDGRLSESEDAYLKTLTADKRSWLLGELDRIEKLRNSGDGSIPSRFRILQLELPDQAKAVALSKLDAMHSDVLSGESSKLKKWIDGLLSIPFGTIRKPLVTIDEGKAKVQEYLDQARQSLNEAVFGHDEPKQKIVQLLCQWIANPESMSLVLGIQGPPGNGKTTLCRKGIAEALERPFVQISLGGATDASVLEGHSYTYVGSTWGRIAGLIMEAQCMNPVIFFDELDKVSDTPRGEEIIGVLTHLTDHSQNKTFTDRYFEGIPLDLSKALFIFSFNDESRLNHVLKDRLTVIHTEGFDQTAKLKISREYLLPELLVNVGLKKGDVDIGKEELHYLCQRCGVPSEEGGVRGIKQALESVILHLNELRMTQDLDEEEEEKADDGHCEAKADGGSSASSAPAHKADGASRQEMKADGGSKDGPCEASAKASTARTEDSTKTEGKKGKKKINVKLPVKLTKELIEQLVNQSKLRRDAPAMMYI